MAKRNYSSKFASMLQLVTESVLVFALATPFATAQEIGYIQITTAQGRITGESKDPGHLGWIKVAKVQYVTRNPTLSITPAGATSATSQSRSAMPGNAARPSADRNGKSDVQAAGGSPTASSDRTSATPAASQSNSAQPGRPAEAPLRDSRSNQPVNAQRIVFVKEIDKLSPRLKLALANGEKFDKVIVDFYRGGSPIRLTLKDVQLYSIQPLPSGQEKHPAEVVSLIAIAPVPQK